MHKSSILALVVMGASPLFASNVFMYLNNEASNQNTETYQGSTIPISPYGGSIGASQSGTG